MSNELLTLVDPKDLLSFSQNFAVNRNTMMDRFFPAKKTPNLVAEFYRLSDPLNIPKMAFVHSLDSEARIGRRPTFEKLRVEKFFIKEKINQTERMQYLIDNGANVQSLINYVFDDAARLNESVLTRVEVMRTELLYKGKITIKENNLNMEMDYGVPTSHFKSLNWAADNAPFLQDIQDIVDDAENHGRKITKCITSTKVVRKLCQNKTLQTLLYSALGVGTFTTAAQLNNIMQASFGFGIETYNDQYKFEKADATLTTRKYIPEDKFILLATLPNGSLGTGLWGVTPEERENGPFTAKSSSQYITTTQWKTPDPVAVWTKASAMYVPVLADPESIYVATITLK